MKCPGCERDDAACGTAGNVPHEQRGFDLTARCGDLTGGDLDDQPGGRYEYPHTCRLTSETRYRMRGAGQERGAEHRDQQCNENRMPRPLRSHGVPPQSDLMVSLPRIKLSPASSRQPTVSRVLSPLPTMSGNDLRQSTWVYSK